MPSSIARICRLYFKYFIKSAKIYVYYNDFFPVMIGGIARDSVAVAAIYFITFRFYDIGGWDMGELIFLYSLLYISYGLAMLFFAGIREVEGNIENGTFDRYLVTPLGVFFQAIVSRVDLLTSFSYCLLGFGLFIYTTNLIDITWDMRNLILLFASLIGGMLIQVSLLLLASILSFWTVRAGNVKFILFFNIRAFSIYPINIYPKAVQLLLMFVLPFAFVNYFPARAILEKDDGFISGNSLASGGFALGSIYAYGSVIAGLILFSTILVIWNRGIKSYKSTGS